jgi:DNA mismatch endonuclease (patch repair protein)
MSTTAGQHAPKANAAFWEAKRTRTRNRDADQRRLLEDAGWEVLTVWECELKDTSALEAHLVEFLGAQQASGRKQASGRQPTPGGI